MAHFQQLQFVEMVARHMAADWAGLRVLEIGSADINGSVRPFFTHSDYTGVDLAAGPDVDVIGSGDTLALPDDHVDLAISCECFEHNPRWCATFVNMHRMAKAGGVVLVTCASRGRLEHGTTRTRPEESPGSQSVGWDYYRNLNREDFERRLDLPQLGYGLAATKTLVRPDQPLKFRDRLRAIKDSPLKWAQYLPDPAYQAFVIRWTAAEKAVRQALGDK